MITPADGAISITPSDTVDLASISRAIYVGTPGALKVDMADDTTVTFVGMLGGTVYPIRAKRVYSTGTVASNLIALL